MVIKRPNLGSKFQELLASFDWKYIEELFNEGIKIGAFGDSNQPIEGMKYPYNGYLYTIERQRIFKGSQIHGVPNVKEKKGF